MKVVPIQPHPLQRLPSFTGIGSIFSQECVGPPLKHAHIPLGRTIRSRCNLA